VSQPDVSAAAPSSVDQSRGPETAHATAYNIRNVGKRFAGYLTGDTLNYLVGFCIYGWLIRVLSNVQYGQLSIITSIYQVLMMVTALGIDLIGPRLISTASEDVGRTIAMLEKLRIAAALFFCLPITLVVALMYYQRSGAVFAELMLASFAMVFARALDLSYVAVAYGLPKHLAKSRLLGLGLYLLTLIVAAPLLGRYLWLVPILNAVGVTIGRIQLKRWLHLHLSLRTGTQPSLTWSTTVLKAGLKASAGQLILLSFQNLDVVYLAHYAPAAVVGQYAMISRLCVLGSAVLASIFFAFMPDMLHASGSPTEFRKTFTRFFIVSAIFGIVGFFGFAFLAGPIAELFAKRTLPVTHEISLYFGITYLLIGVGAPFYSVLAAFKRERSYLFSICSGAVALLITDVLLVPHHAASGAAIGQAVAALVIFVTSSVLLLRKEILRDAPKFDATLFAPTGLQ
jgi:O-antigen/teichoic acid export membrane protein